MQLDEVGSKEERIAETIELLRQLGLPTAQQNQRSALTLLALLDLRPGTDWADVTTPRLGVTPIMGWMAEHYDKQYKPNTRETIRRQTLHQFVDAGLVMQNPDVDVAVNSPGNVYAVPDQVVALLRHAGSDDWPQALATWTELAGSLTERWAAEREMAMIPVKLPNGESVSLTSGGQNPLMKSIVEDFAPRFAPGAELLYLGDAGEKYVVDERVRLAELGIEIDEHGKMPDVVLYDPDRNWLLLVEAVTSHGPVDPLRKSALEDLFSEATAGLVFVTAFPNRSTWLKFPDVAWETEIWLADAPSHMIHLNGDRFLGPH